MINEAIGKFLIFNGEVESTEGSEYFDKVTKAPLYEVITVREGIAIFFEEHMERLDRTSKMLGINLSKKAREIEDYFYKLIDKNGIKDAFIKLIIFEDNYLVYEFWDRYPEKEDLEEGINVSIFDYERENPNAKILITDFKAEVSKFLIETGAFEAILRTEAGELLEGSRTNLYFTSRNKVITAPDDRVLKGITRTRLERIFDRKNIQVEKRVIKDIDLVDIDGAFLTGTTVGLVPIKNFESIELDVKNNELVREVVQGYEDLQREYIESKKEK